MDKPRQTFLDRALGYVAPRWQLHRTRAKLATDLLLRHYEGAAVSRRTQNWNRQPSDANTALSGSTLARLREVARDMVRNNPYAESAVATIADHVVGWGITATPKLPPGTAAPSGTKPSLSWWKAWAETTACDADGRNDLYGLQKLIIRSVVESGEVLIRRRMRLPSDGLPIPMQLQVLEADYLDHLRTVPLPNGGKITQGVEFDAIGNRVAYWLFPQHPGSLVFTNQTASMFPSSRRIPASEIIHVFKQQRPGQVRGASWFAPVMVRLKDFDEYADATLMKQKIAACLAVITTDVDGTSAPIGTADDTVNPGIDTISPGAIINTPPGRSIEVVQPPAVSDFKDYASATAREIATGIGVTYEDLTGDFSQVNFSSARMARLKHWARVQDWRWRMLVPQFCDGVWSWANQVAEVAGLETAPAVSWTAPPLAMIDPDKEGLAYQRNVRSGIQTLSEAIRERGYDPDELLQEMAADNAKLDALGIVLDSDPRRMTQAGQAQSIQMGAS